LCNPQKKKDVSANVLKDSTINNYI